MAEKSFYDGWLDAKIQRTANPPITYYEYRELDGANFLPVNPGPTTVERRLITLTQFTDGSSSWYEAEEGPVEPYSQA
jgi:hypothetical protein